MAKGDEVEILLAAGDKVERIKVSAWKAGQSVIVDRPRGSLQMDIIVQDRNGNAQRTVTCMSSAVLATIQRPAGQK